jgi:hypothetical protein
MTWLKPGSIFECDEEQAVAGWVDRVRALIVSEAMISKIILVRR